MIIVHNPTEAPVKDYPIQDPKTKEVHLWSILPGQTLEFPDYAGEYLLTIYRFLQKVVTQEERQAELDLKDKVDKGKQFSRVKIVEAPKKVIDKPMTEPGFTNEAAKRNAPTPQQLNPQPVVPTSTAPQVVSTPPVEQPMVQPEVQVSQQPEAPPTSGNVAGSLPTPVAQSQVAPLPQPVANRSTQPAPVDPSQQIPTQ